MTLRCLGNGELVGISAEDDQKWKRTKAWIKRLAKGDIVAFSYRRRRSGPFHRKYMAMVRHAFEHWDPEVRGAPLTYKGHIVAKDFDHFRKEILILAGFFDVIYTVDGGVRFEALSINFDEMEQDDFEKVYEPTLSVLLEHVLHNYNRADLERVVAELQEFGQ